jgi:hypothetical protein
MPCAQILRTILLIPLIEQKAVTFTERVRRHFALNGNRTPGEAVTTFGAHSTAYADQVRARTSARLAVADDAPRRPDDALPRPDVTTPRPWPRRRRITGSPPAEAWRATARWPGPHGGTSDAAAGRTMARAGGPPGAPGWGRTGRLPGSLGQVGSP